MIGLQIEFRIKFKRGADLIKALTMSFGIYLNQGERDRYSTDLSRSNTQKHS